jgi:hypothetical protein
MSDANPTEVPQPEQQPSEPVAPVGVDQQPDQQSQEPSEPVAPVGVEQSAPEVNVTTDQTVKPEEAGGKSYEDVAKEVLAGEWGVGHRREERLELAGYNKGAVQEALRKLLGREDYQGVENRGVQNTVDTRETQDG